LSAEDNLHPLVETFVEEDTLVVRVKPSTMVAPGRTLDVTITNDLLEGLQASGGSRVTAVATPSERFPVTASGGSVVQVTSLSSTEFSIDASGGSEVTVSGAATGAQVEASGGSDLLLQGVPLQWLRVTASGGATVLARVSQTLTGKASGGSTITVIGTPASTVATSGGSQVRVGAVP
jgi:hypothetical protein